MPNRSNLTLAVVSALLSFVIIQLFSPQISTSLNYLFMSKTTYYLPTGESTRVREMTPLGSKFNTLFADYLMPSFIFGMVYLSGSQIIKSRDSKLGLVFLPRPPYLILIAVVAVLTITPNILGFSSCFFLCFPWAFKIFLALALLQLSYLPFSLFSVWFSSSNRNLKVR